MNTLPTVLGFSTPGGWEVIVLLALLFGFVLLTRLFGAWMLRINEVIDLLKSIREILKKKNENA